MSGHLLSSVYRRLCPLNTGILHPTALTSVYLFALLDNYTIFILTAIFLLTRQPFLIRLHVTDFILPFRQSPNL
jgi:hypothetical protein